MPKALVEVGDRPLLWHVVSSYERQGFSEFLFLTGHLGNQIEAYIETGDLPASGSYRALNTGEDTLTGERVLRARGEVGNGTFCLTYVDGLSNIDFETELEFHREHGRVATVALVRPRLQWGVARLEGSEVTGFSEKPVSDEWINGGFFCLEQSVFGWLEEAESLEGGPLERLAGAGELMGYLHHGYWDCVDTYKDLLEVNELWKKGDPPWLAAS